MPRTRVSKPMAERALAEIRRLFAEILEGDPEGPVLYEPGYHADCWVIGWEGPADWTQRASEHLGTVPALTSKSIWTEALTHCHLKILRG